MTNRKIIRASTVPMSLVFVKDMLSKLKKKYDVALLSSSGTKWVEVRQLHQDVYMERHIFLRNAMKSLW